MADCSGIDFEIQQQIPHPFGFLYLGFPYLGFDWKALELEPTLVMVKLRSKSEEERLLASLLSDVGLLVGKLPRLPCCPR